VKTCDYYYLQCNAMGKTCKVVVCGQAAVGKTAILEQLINGDHVVGSVSVYLSLHKLVVI